MLKTGRSENANFAQNSVLYKEPFEQAKKG